MPKWANITLAVATLVIAVFTIIIGVIAVLNFDQNRGQDYQMGQIDARLTSIEQDVAEIKVRLDQTATKDDIERILNALIYHQHDEDGNPTFTRPIMGR